MVNLRQQLTGMQFGKLLVINQAADIIGGKSIKKIFSAWNCLCECGNMIVAKSINLKQGYIKSCGCLIKKHGITYKPGQKINRLTTISYKKGSKWLCHCDCGNIVEVKTGALTSGNTKSCGCLKEEISSQQAPLLIKGRRQFAPRIASARRIWKKYCRNKQCQIEFEKFFEISQMNCHYCKTKPCLKFNHFNTLSSRSSKKAQLEGLFIYNQINLLDNDKGYVVDNIIPCCHSCNKAKNNLSNENFAQWINKFKTKRSKSSKIKK